MSVSITAINFHEGDSSYSLNVQGGRGYSLPAGRVSVTVDFKVALRDANYITITEVFSGRTFPSYDALVDAAYRQLADRLEGYGEIAKHLKASFQKEKAA
jgi:hypothetical protein